MSPTTEWLTSTQIAKRFRVSRNTLLALREKGVLRPGEHFLVQGVRAIYDAAAVETALKEHTKRVVAQGEVYAAEAS